MYNRHFTSIDTIKYICIKQMLQICDRDLWLSGIWLLLTGVTLVISSVFGLVVGTNLYTFDVRLDET